MSSSYPLIVSPHQHCIFPSITCQLNQSIFNLPLKRKRVSLPCPNPHLAFPRFPPWLNPVHGLSSRAVPLSLRITVSHSSPNISSYDRLLRVATPALSTFIVSEKANNSLTVNMQTCPNSFSCVRDSLRQTVDMVVGGWLPCHFPAWALAQHLSVLPLPLQLDHLLNPYLVLNHHSLTFKLSKCNICILLGNYSCDANPIAPVSATYEVRTHTSRVRTSTSPHQLSHSLNQDPCPLQPH
jgi:hypothetical protein